jgi:hypothetical protein
MKLFLPILAVGVMLTAASCKDDDPYAAIPAGTTGCFVFMERDEIKEAFSKLPNKLNHKQVNGFALGGGTKNCRITVPPLYGRTDSEAIDTLLHEIRHCAYGNYHS